MSDTFSLNLILYALFIQIDEWKDILDLIGEKKIIFERFLIH